ncbi:taperin [Sinocyclocheilus grahami]|uniref:Taperin-like n=1 Tax=Sinocyclocheilus grahami TaxID=75366 RepID=A0A672JYN0_SINGR|nr:PREDICTED: taperin-like [Sinocyclocheilus grahami]
MSGGDLRVLRQEPGQESPRMPAWKREILERRKAKGGGAGAESVASRLNGEVTASKSKDDITGAHASTNSTITAAKRATKSPDLSPVKTKEHWPSADPSRTEERTARDIRAQESLVLQESLGPLQENPFIKLEKERKKRQSQENAARPVQHILELYGSVPGIRTIRAENIIIIESDPEYFSEGCGLKHASKLQQNGTVSGYSSLNDLLDRRGSPVTEIRAKEVVIYDTALSKSEENLSTLGRPASSPLEGQGRVSRMLQKFDRNYYGKLQPKSRSTENLLDLDSSPIRPSSRPKPDVVPKCPLSPQAGSSHSKVFQNVQSSMSNHHASPSGSESSSPVSGSPQLVSSARRRFEGSGGRSVTVYPKEDTERSPSKPVRERDWDSTDGASRAKVPCSPESHRARADCTPSPTSPPLSPSFEIRPSPHPDLSLLPAGDLQARALANLRLQSRNSFTVIPKSRAAISSPGSTAPSSPVLSPPSPRPLVGVAALEPAVPTPSPASFIPSTPKLTEKVTIEAKTASPQHTPPATPTSPAPASPPSIGSPVKPVPSPDDELPITNIDDIVVEPTPPVLSPAVQRRKGNTFTVVPKRRPEAQSGPAETPEVVNESQSTPQAPYAHLGTLIKKRYPAAEEIVVIGGYLSLGRSCLSKTGSTGKKLKISFNESSLQSTFEYPSESSVWDSGEDEEEGEEKEGEDDGGLIAGRISIPRASYTSSHTHSNNTTDLSSYTPKHSVEFNAWQEHKLDESDTSQSTEEVMLTPADSSSLSDFSSEPALYF